MKSVLIQSYYQIQLKPIEMGKIRKMRSLTDIINRIGYISEVRGVTFTPAAIEVNISGRDASETLAQVESIIKEALI